jgi:hypothetical protein
MTHYKEGVNTFWKQWELPWEDIAVPGLASDWSLLRKQTVLQTKINFRTVVSMSGEEEEQMLRKALREYYRMSHLWGPALYMKLCIITMTMIITVVLSLLGLQQPKHCSEAAVKLAGTYFRWHGNRFSQSNFGVPMPIFVPPIVSSVIYEYLPRVGTVGRFVKAVPDDCCFATRGRKTSQNFVQIDQTISESNTASCPVNTGGSALRITLPEGEMHRTPSSAYNEEPVWRGRDRDCRPTACAKHN